MVGNEPEITCLSDIALLYLKYDYQPENEVAIQIDLVINIIFHIS